MKIKRLILASFCFMAFINSSTSQELFNMEKIKTELRSNDRSFLKKEFIVSYSEVAKIISSPSYLESVTGDGYKYFTSSIYYWSKNDDLKTLPINDKYFDYDSWRVNIPEAHRDSKPEVIISTHIYKTDSDPVIFVTGIRLKEE